MISIGRNVRWFNRYIDEVEFCKRNRFDFLQIWYDSGGFGLLEKSEAPLKMIKETGFPAIIHALLDINEIPEETPKLLDILSFLGHEEIIIHPVCKSEPIMKETIRKLIENLQYMNGFFSQNSIKIYLENNSRLDPLINSIEEIKYVFSEIPELGFLIDIAHIDNYDHLREMVKIKTPCALHVSDRHLEKVHEHLAIGEGNIDFEYVFKEILNGFEGKIIFEIVESDEKILNSKSIVESILRNFDVFRNSEIVGDMP